MKIIFLDFDGVLNHQNWYKKRSELKPESDKEWSEQYPFYEFDPESIKLLNNIIEKTDAKVVVSSSWRNGRTVDDLQKILSKVGFIGEVIDKTPHFYSKGEKDGATIRYSTPRGCEIDWWLKERGNFQRINWSIHEQLKTLENSLVKNYIILDDDSDMLYSQREHFLKTSTKDGLTKNIAHKAIEILNKPIIELYYV